MHRNSPLSSFVPLVTGNQFRRNQRDIGLSGPRPEYGDTGGGKTIGVSSDSKLDIAYGVTSHRGSIPVLNSCSIIVCVHQVSKI